MDYDRGTGEARDDAEASGAGGEEERLFAIHGRYGSEMVTILDRNGIPRYESPSIERILGYRPIDSFGGDASGGSWTESVHPDDVAKIARSVQRGLSEVGEHPPIEYRIRDAEGRWRWFESRAINLLDDPEIAGLVVSSREVTDRRTAEERFRSAFEDAPLGVALVGPDRRYVRVNASLCRMLGYTEEQLLEKTATEVSHPLDLSSGPGRVGWALNGGAGTLALEKRLVRSDGDQIWVLESASLVRDSQGEPTHFVALYQDITDRKRAEEALAKSARRLRAVAEGAPVILFSVDREGMFTFESGRSFAALGLTPDPAPGRPVSEVFADQPGILENVYRALAGEEVADTVELDGSRGRRFFDTRYSPLRDEEGQVEGIVGVATDVTERRRLEQELAHRATHDPLTDLPNRTLFMDRLARALKRARRHGGTLAVMFMDLDGFKAVNDSMGHDAGDRLLVGMARRLERTLGPSDVACRMGGDEFVVLLADADARSASRAAERMLSDLAEPLRIPPSRTSPLGMSDGEPEHGITASIGFAVWPGGDAANGPEDLLRAADRAMYDAKTAGKAGYSGA